MVGRFVGRSQEFGVLESALADVRAARPRVVFVHGPAGIGKSALVRRFLTSLQEVAVLEASGDENESALAYGVVGQLLAGLPRSLPAPLSSLETGQTADPLTVGAAGLVQLLGVLQDQGPVVLVVDDAHWADTPSLQAVIFALRRLRVDRVLGLVSARDEALPSLPPSLERLVAGESGVELPLVGLQIPEIRELAASMGAAELPASAAERLREQPAAARCTSAPC